jgi:zinc protease
MRRFLFINIILLFGLIVGCQKSEVLKVDFEKYTLDNGLEVILHQDNSDPIASVAVAYHVGSNREVKGRTGFAHLFEHMLFQESQHVGQDQFFKKIQNAGGTLNGFTFKDGTAYYEIVPKNSLEMAMWMESDRMGWLLSTVTEEALLNQKDVVQNEKRQRVDNRPYGHTRYILGKLLYPEGHPYNWQVIGELEDLANATRDDVAGFYKKWYGPNNATLVIAGDLDIPQTKEWVQKYFGEIKRGPDVSDPEPMPVKLNVIKKAYYEDNFARSPEINIVFPTMEQYTKDAYALDLLSDLMAVGKKSPLYKVIVEDQKLAPSAGAFINNDEMAGSFQVRVRAFPKTNLTKVEDAIFKAFKLFEDEGFTEKDLGRVKAKAETRFYDQITSILNKSIQLAFYNEFMGTPGYISKDLKNMLAVTSEDIKRVYNTYIKDKNFVLTSFVPKGQTDLVVEGSEPFPLAEEKIDIAGLSAANEASTKIEQPEKIPTSFDRSSEPEKGPAVSVNIPEVWEHTFSNGLKIYGIQHDELPLVRFNLRLKGGMLLDSPDKIGVANLVADIMMEGTAKRTPVELQEAIDALGATIRMTSSKQSINVTADMLKSRVQPVYNLFEEILMEPRWDEKEFERIKKETVENLNRRKADPGAIARKVYDKLIYGDHILANDTFGSEENVNTVSIDDLKEFYKANFSPSVSYITIAGNISKDEAIAIFTPLQDKWTAKEVTFADYELPPAVEKSTVYFVDVPNAKQSEIRIGYLALPYNHDDYYPAYVMNYKLGGSFSGSLNLILREEKGFTYGARSGFSGTEYPGPFTARSAVRSNSTGESVQIFKDQINKYRDGISEDDFAFTKNALLQSNARNFETLGNLIGMLNRIARHNLPYDYIKQREEIVKNMTLEQHKALAQKYLDANKMIYLVVGDAKTQMKEVEALGFGKPIMLNNDGNKIN